MTENPANLPSSPKAWAEEAVDALRQARALTAKIESEGESQLFKYAALFCCKNRNIQDPSQRQAIIQLVNQNRFNDFAQDPEAKLSPTLNFLLAFFDAHYSQNLISEADLEQAMAYAIDNFSIFNADLNDEA